MSQCHDSYEANEGQSSPTAPETLRVYPAHECRLSNTRVGPIRVVRVVGTLDWSTDEPFEGLMCDTCTEPMVVVDLSASRLDAAGTGALLVATEQAHRRGQQLVLVVTNHVQRAVMAATGLSERVPVAASESEALEWCAQNGSSPLSVDPSATNHVLVQS